MLNGRKDSHLWVLINPRRLVPTGAGQIGRHMPLLPPTCDGRLMSVVGTCTGSKQAKSKQEKPHQGTTGTISAYRGQYLRT